MEQTKIKQIKQKSESDKSKQAKNFKSNTCFTQKIRNQQKTKLLTSFNLEKVTNAISNTLGLNLIPVRANVHKWKNKNKQH